MSFNADKAMVRPCAPQYVLAIVNSEYFFLCRKDLNQLLMFNQSLCTEIKDAEMTIALTEQKCASERQHIPEMRELEKTEKDQVPYSK